MKKTPNNSKWAAQFDRVPKLYFQLRDNKVGAAVIMSNGQ